MTTQQTAPTSEKTTTAYHWIMTVQVGQTLNTRSAIVDVPTGYTRQQILQFVLDQFERDYGKPIVVVFFDLQPNQL